MQLQLYRSLAKRKRHVSKGSVETLLDDLENIYILLYDKLTQDS